MTVRQAVLLGHPRAWARLADYTRSKGGTYRDAYDWVCRVFAEAGKEAPSLAEFDAKLYEVEAHGD